MAAGSGNQNRIFIAAGGTGGHIFPALAVMDELVKLHPDLLATWFGSTHRMESDLIPARKIDFVGLKTTEFRRKPTLSNIFYNIRSLWYLAGSIFSSIGQVRKLNPGVVLTTGGFAAGAMGLASWFTRTPLVIIEPNAYPGMTNRWLGKRAALVFTAYDKAAKFFPKGRTFIVGTPARSDLITKSRAESRSELGLSDDTVFIVATGGSQGASGINSNLPESIVLLLNMSPVLKLKVLHQCGKGKQASVRVDDTRFPRENYVVVEFIDNIPLILAAADIVVCRAGASTLTEVAVRGLPAVIIPYAQSAENHQVKNARTWESEGAGYCIEEKDLTPESLAEKLSILISDEKKRKQLGESARKFGNPDSAVVIAQKLSELLKNRVS